METDLTRKGTYKRDAVLRREWAQIVGPGPDVAPICVSQQSSDIGVTVTGQGKNLAVCFDPDDFGGAHARKSNYLRLSCQTNLDLTQPLGLTLRQMSNELIDPERRGVGGRLKAAREMAKLTQDAVATRFGVNKATVSAWETGRGDPGVFRLRELAKLYKTSAEGLLFDDAPTSEAMQMAAQFDSLSEKAKSTFKAVWMAFAQQGITDEEVEARMNITQVDKEKK